MFLTRGPDTKRLSRNHCLPEQERTLESTQIQPLISQTEAQKEEVTCPRSHSKVTQ